MSSQLLSWIGFNVFVVLMLILDQTVFHRRSREIKIKEALLWSAAWIALALFFNLGIYFYRGPKPALEFLTGYLIEESLSIDNLFVFVLIFAYFKVPAQYQHKVLFWGIVGAQVMRGIFIFAGVALIHRFEWIIYIFGAFLLFAAFKMFVQKENIHPEDNPLVKFIQRFLPVVHSYEDDRFFIKRGGRIMATSLFIVLLVVDITDLIFALDSIPAVLAITHDPFIVYTSNIFAILGLRALYFVLAKMIDTFHYLHYGLAIILGFVGTKMLLSKTVEIPIIVALGIVVLTLIGSIALSLIFPSPKKFSKA